ncbi:hypothetical protein ACFL02_04000 [Planctomycetota bacterium]
MNKQTEEIQELEEALKDDHIFKKLDTPRKKLRRRLIDCAFWGVIVLLVFLTIATKGRFWIFWWEYMHHLLGLPEAWH